MGSITASTGAPTGAKIRFGGQEKPLQAGQVTFPLAADSLRVGDNTVLADVLYPEGDTESAEITLAVDYRIRADLAPMEGDESAIDVVVNALPGTQVSLDGEDVKLDADGRAVKRFAIDVATSSALLWEPKMRTETSSPS